MGMRKLRSYWSEKSGETKKSVYQRRQRGPRTVPCLPTTVTVHGPRCTVRAFCFYRPTMNLSFSPAPALYNSAMARGWESKSVEAQQEEAVARKPDSGQPPTPEELQRRQHRETLRLARARVLQQVPGLAGHPLHRDAPEEPRRSRPPARLVARSGTLQAGHPRPQSVGAPTVLPVRSPQL